MWSGEGCGRGSGAIAAAHPFDDMLGRSWQYGCVKNIFVTLCYFMLFLLFNAVSGGSYLLQFEALCQSCFLPHAMS